MPSAATARAMAADALRKPPFGRRSRAGADSATAAQMSEASARAARPKNDIKINYLQQGAR
jgi:hypothetical protein